ncbi:MAG: small multi-drug export protein [Spirochaetes bacterium]|nr:small multi-drug export protein [Spirochaetota bacterium]
MAPFLVTGILSMLPIFELRGGIPVGIAVFKLHPAAVYAVCVLFNLVPVLPVLFLLLPVKRVLERIPFFKRFFDLLLRRVERNKRLIERTREFGLLLFVSVPLPVTGAWTGSLIAVIMGLATFKSFLFIALGVLAAGVIVTVITLMGTTGIFIAALLFSAAAGIWISRLLKERKNASSARKTSEDASLDLD